MEPLLELTDVRFAYEEGIPALAGVSLAVRPGERLAVLGANGCGKSTLLKILGGLVFPLAGSYRAFGREVSEPLLSRTPFGMFFRKTVGILFQNPDAQLFNPTVEDEIAFGLLQMNEPADVVSAKVRETLMAFGLERLAGRPPFALSAGEKKKVAVASVLAMDPRVLLLDEPTASLDPRSSRALVDVLLAERRERTVITATHDLHILPEIATRVLVLGEGGEVLASGRPEEILADRPLLLAANLVHIHRHAHEGYRHVHEHEYTEAVHVPGRPDLRGGTGGGAER